jgi:hypothetical protein
MLFFGTLFHFFNKPTLDCGELLRYFAQLGKQEGWITCPSHGNSNTVFTAGDCFWVTKLIADL